MERVRGKVAVVTGGAGGLGSEICRSLHEEGATVVAADVLGEREVAPEVVRDAYRQLDITDESSVERVFGGIAEECGGIDVLVNNAGVTGPIKPSHEASEAEFAQVFDVNVKGSWLCTKHALAHMLPAGAGSIVNLSSINGLVGGSRIPLYHATKGAVRLMSKADAVTYAKSGVRVNSVHPGSIETELSKKLSADPDEDAEQYARQMLESTPMGHRGTPRDIANAVVYLASDESRFVTGTELVVDGGYTAA